MGDSAGAMLLQLLDLEDLLLLLPFPSQVLLPFELFLRNLR
jgi:hypothetical protein